ncbi:MAG: YihY/virulence factor BrkB family protein [Eubacteriales bacterium]
MKKWYELIWKVIRRNGENNLSAYAASAAFFIFLSMIPMLLCICVVIPYTNLTQSNLILVATEILPTTVEPFAISLISEVYHQSPAILSIAALTLVWSAAKGILAIMRSLQVIHHVTESRGYIRLRIQASFYTVLLMFGILITLFLMVFGNQIVLFCVEIVPSLQLVVSLFIYLRYFVMCVILSLLFMVLYTKIPNKEMEFTKQFPGALLASVGWILFSWCFSLYVDHFNGFNMYGSLSTIVVIMLWLYICMYILLFGAQVNESMTEQIYLLYKKYEKS